MKTSHDRHKFFAFSPTLCHDGRVRIFTYLWRHPDGIVTKGSHYIAMMAS